MSSKPNKGTIYLIPTSLGSAELADVLPWKVFETIGELQHFAVENIRTARRFIKSTNRSINIDELTITELSKRTDESEIHKLLEPVRKGISLGVISEAGCPAVADPGSGLVAIAHRENITVCPLVGPSSILMALMASGMNGQAFTFHGYVPKDRHERIRKIKEWEQQVSESGYSQIFMETPFRNNHVLEDLLECCKAGTLLCIAADISTETESIRTKKVDAWKNTKVDLHKRPCIFILGA